MRPRKGQRVLVLLRDTSSFTGTCRYPDQSSRTAVIDCDDGQTRRVHYSALHRENEG
jgi:hypothetical protein